MVYVSPMKEFGGSLTCKVIADSAEEVDDAERMLKVERKWMNTRKVFIIAWHRWCLTVKDEDVRSVLLSRGASSVDSELFKSLTRGNYHAKKIRQQDPHRRGAQKVEADIRGRRQKDECPGDRRVRRQQAGTKNEAAKKLKGVKRADPTQ